jgi:hypothetical protein
MTTFGWRLAIACMFVLGCATAQPQQPTVDMNGTWAGGYTGGSTSQPRRGTVTMTLRQTGSEVTGETVSDTPALNGPIRGTVSGNTFSWASPGEGGRAAVEGNSMNGTTHGDRVSSNTITLQRR